MVVSPEALDLAPGFADPVRQSQQAFRAALDALSYPGRVVTVPGCVAAPPLGPAQATLALTLVDFETPVWLDEAAAGAAAWLRFHCGCPIVETPAAARFAFVAAPDAMPPLAAFDAGSDEYPDRAAALVLAVRGLSGTGDLRLVGPGVPDEAALGAEGLPPDFQAQWRQNRELFPRGVDLFLTDGDRLAGLPRTTRVRASEPSVDRASCFETAAGAASSA